MLLSQFLVSLRHCGRIQAFQHGKSLHSHLIKLGFLNNVFVCNNLIAMYVGFAFLDDANKVFDGMLERNEVTWTTMISGYTNNGKADTGIKLYTEMVDSKAEVANSFLYSIVLKACASLGNLQIGRFIHGRISYRRLEFETVLMNSLIDMYVKCGKLKDAQKVFRDILVPNSTSFNILISGYNKEGYMEEMIGIICTMHQKGIKLDDFTFPCALKACSSLSLLALGKLIHCYIVKSGFTCSCFTFSSLIDMYSNCRQMIEAVKLFNQYPDCKPSTSGSLAVLNSMLSGYVDNEQNVSAINLISQIHSSGMQTDCYTLSNALKVCLNLNNLRLGHQVHALAVINGYELDYIIGSILVDFYVKSRRVSYALCLFQRLPIKDIVAWSCLISGCAKIGLNSLAFTLYRDMIRLGLQVDHFIISSVIRACSSLAGLTSGKQVHAFCIKSGYEIEEVIVTSLVDMYSKCGEIEDGLALFNHISERDSVLWTGIIVGCGRNGREREAIMVFKDMIRSGFKPNEVTLLGVLSACKHAGLVDEGLTIFKSMETEHGIEPSLEHYYCIIGLLGQAGFFEEAEELINVMPFEANTIVWRSLLVACVTHKRTEMVDLIAKHLLATSADDPSVYVTLSNVYATMGMWENSSKLRATMKEVGLKEAGQSWIQTTG